MAPRSRRANIRTLAKINLTLEVLNKRPDGYHELRTIFQTISVADRMEITYTPGGRRRLSLKSETDIPDNLALIAAEAVMKATNAKGSLEFRLLKRIPLGAGLGGGSSDAAAVLLSIPVLTGHRLPWQELLQMAARLGSDVPFFLVGGTALGLGRGTELVPIEDVPPQPALLVTPGVHVSTAGAYRALGRSLTSPPPSPKINISQSLALAIGVGLSAEGWAGFCSNDFEPVVFRQHPELGAIKNNLREAGAHLALMTGSGSAIFGLFQNKELAGRARQSFRGKQALPFSFVSRARYRRLWWNQLGEHIEGKSWPPRSRYSD